MTDRPLPATRVLIVIPARYGSSRFPGKALADLHGKPLIVRVADNAAAVPGAMVAVGTDDARIRDAVVAAGHRCLLTGPHPTGTDRVGEVAAACDAELVLNLQGDEPLLDPAIPQALIAFMDARPEFAVGTCAHAFAGPAQWRDPNAVKVVAAEDGTALYFSRAPIPGTFPGGPERGPAVALRHVGLYAFRRDALRRFLALPRTALEEAEGLEQLRALAHGMRIGVLRIAAGPVGVDTPQDLEVVRRLWPGGGGA